VIEIRNLAKYFTHGRGRKARTVRAVDGVSFTAANGCITGLLGPNGAGKTTILRIVAGLIAPDSGEARVDGIDAGRDSRLALARMGVLSDARGLYPRLTARENIAYYGRLHGMAEEAVQSRTEHVADVLEMRRLLDRRAEGFSQGERMKTALARALVHDPPNIILDEPTNGLDVLATRSLRATLRRLRDEQGKCVVFSTHIMQEVERLCDHVVLISHGHVVASGTVTELCERGGERDFEEAFVHLAFTREEQEAGTEGGMP
jgi:sodium transport system ATP-binding protein